MYAVMRVFKRFYIQSSTKVDLSNEKRATQYQIVTLEKNDLKIIKVSFYYYRYAIGRFAFVEQSLNFYQFYY